MTVFGKEIVEEYLSRHSNIRTSYLKRIDKVEVATFKNHNELKAVFPKADYAGNKRYVFVLKGNHYRLIAVA
jgi:mRNA interferase HigB